MNDLMKSIERAALTPIVVGEDHSAERKFSFGEEFIGFSGHFPGFPIVPAIVQILIAQSLIEGCVGAPGCRKGQVSSATRTGPGN